MPQSAATHLAPRYAGIEREGVRTGTLATLIIQMTRQKPTFAKNSTLASKESPPGPLRHIALLLVHALEDAVEAADKGPGRQRHAEY